MKKLKFCGKKVRLEKGYTQTEIAERCGLSKSCINNYEHSSVNNVRLSTVEKYMNGLGVGLNELLEIEER